MRMLIICPCAGSGGTEKFSVLLGGAMTQAGWDVHGAIPQPGNQYSTALWQSLEQVGVHPHRLEVDDEPRAVQTKPWIARRFWRTFRLLRKVRPDMVWIQVPYPDRCIGTALACAVLRIPTVLVFHVIPPGLLLGPNLARWHRWCRSRGQTWVAVSQIGARMLGAYLQVPAGQIRCIYNGRPATSPVTFDREETRREICEELKLPGDTRLLLNAARLGSGKGLEDLVPCLPHLRDEFPNVVFLWAGDGPRRQPAEKLIADYGVQDRIRLLGHRSDMPRLMAGAELFVFPTHFEGCPLALLEAMAAGLPVVTSNATSIPEIVTHQEHGLIFRAHDSCDLLESLRWALRHPDAMQQMGLAARARADDFTQDRMIEQYQSLFASLVPGQ